MFGYRSGALFTLAVWSALAGFAPGAAQAENYAFLVGVADYDARQFKPLRYTRDDVLALREALLASGFADENVVLMHDDLARLPSRRYIPHAEEIRKEFRLLLDGLEENDTLLVAFAGHGVQFKGEKANYFCPADANLEKRETLISLTEIYEELDNCPAERKLLLVDACRNDPQAAFARSRRSVEVESVTRPQLAATPAGIMALFSCAAGQESFEDEKLRHGVFFYHWLEGLRGAADDGDGELTLDELATYVRKKTEAYSRRTFAVSQTPQLRGEFSGAWVVRTLTADARIDVSHLPAGARAALVVFPQRALAARYIEPTASFMFSSVASDYQEAGIGPSDVQQVLIALAPGSSAQAQVRMAVILHFARPVEMLKLRGKPEAPLVWKRAVTQDKTYFIANENEVAGYQPDPQTLILFPPSFAEWALAGSELPSPLAAMLGRGGPEQELTFVSDARFAADLLADMAVYDPPAGLTEVAENLRSCSWVEIHADAGESLTLSCTANADSPSTARTLQTAGETLRQSLQDALNDRANDVKRGSPPAVGKAIEDLLLHAVAAAEFNTTGSKATIRVTADPQRLQPFASPEFPERLKEMQQTARDTAEKVKFMFVALALQSYEAATLKLPPRVQRDGAGRPLLSWRVLVLPYLGQEELFKQFRLDEPWDSAHNRSLIAKMPSDYKSAGLPEGKTCVLAVTGKGTIFESEGGLDYASIRDGLSTSIMLVEAEPERAVVWTKPEDFEYNEARPGEGLLTKRPRGALAVFADGHVARLPQDTPAETLRRLFQIADGQPVEAP